MGISKIKQKKLWTENSKQIISKLQNCQLKTDSLLLRNSKYVELYEEKVMKQKLYSAQNHERFYKRPDILKTQNPNEIQKHIHRIWNIFKELHWTSCCESCTAYKSGQKSKTRKRLWRFRTNGNSKSYVNILFRFVGFKMYTT